MRILLSTAAVVLLLALAGSAQTYTVLHSFEATDGAEPYAGLVQGLDGSFYGMTSDIGLGQSVHGTIFKITPGGKFTTLHAFNGLGDGGRPEDALTLTPDGSFYGVTNGGGFIAAGTVFKYSDGVVTTLHEFDRKAGSFPRGSLLLAADGNLYGTTTDTGDKLETAGTVFRVTPDGTLTIIYNFPYQGEDGNTPYGQLVQNRNGALYGIANKGGANGAGTIYKIDQAGSVTTLYSFCSLDDCADGTNVQAGLTLGADGVFYGATYGGGDISCNAKGSCGTLFKYTPSGLTTLHTFEFTEGALPAASLYQATDGNLYGTASEGGNTEGSFNCSFFGCGTAFGITPSGTFTLLHTFCEIQDCSDGSFPVAPLVQGTDGNFYGTTSGGGTSSYGTVFKLSLGLPPFVKLLPAFGVTGQSIRILGNNLLGTTGVTFNGTPAEFTVNTNSFITAKVPAGATSGAVQVTTTNGILSSNVTFHVSR